MGADVCVGGHQDLLVGHFGADEDEKRPWRSPSQVLHHGAAENRIGLTVTPRGPEVHGPLGRLVQRHSDQDVADDDDEPAKAVKPGDLLKVRRPPYETILAVTAVSEKRGSANIARELYAETTESIVAREQLQAELRDQPPPIFKGRPTKRDRRTLENWQRAAELVRDDD